MSLVPRTFNGRDSAFSEVDEYTVSLSKRLALRVYSDTRPQNGKIADLQKGLILVYEGTESVAEGTGFGVPIIVSNGETYFSGSSHVYASQQGRSTIIHKDFIMDHIARNTFRNVHVKNHKARAALRYVAKLYRRNKHLQSLTMKKLSQKVGYDTLFLKTTPVGTVSVKFHLSESHVKVEADLTQLKQKNLQRMFMLNEQGAMFFRKYKDSTGAELYDKEIGAWNPIIAEWASLTSPDNDVGFRLRQVDDCFLRRGREYLRDCLDWVGLDYEVNARESFEYDIEISEEARRLE